MPASYQMLNISVELMQTIESESLGSNPFLAIIETLVARARFLQNAPTKYPRSTKSAHIFACRPTRRCSVESRKSFPARGRGTTEQLLTVHAGIRGARDLGISTGKQEKVRSPGDSGVKGLTWIARGQGSSPGSGRHGREADTARRPGRTAGRSFVIGTFAYFAVNRRYRNGSSGIERATNGPDAHVPGGAMSLARRW